MENKIDDLGLEWAKALNKMDINDLQWMCDNNIFGNNNNRFVKNMNNMLLARIDKLKIAT